MRERPPPLFDEQQPMQQAETVSFPPLPERVVAGERRRNGAGGRGRGGGAEEERARVSSLLPAIISPRDMAALGIKPRDSDMF